MISDNTGKSNVCNVYLNAGKVLEIAGGLEDGAVVGVSMDLVGVFTSGLSGRGVIGNFTSDDSVLTVCQKDGEAALTLNPAFIPILSPTLAPATDTASVSATQEVVTIAKAPAGVKAKARKNKVTVSWKKIKKTKKTKALLSQIAGVQVQYAADAGFAQVLGVASLGKSKTKATLKLARKTIYYIRVRYVDANGGVSNWSAIKKVKTK